MWTAPSKPRVRSDFLEDLSGLLAPTEDRWRKRPVRHRLVAAETRQPVGRRRRRLHRIYRVHAGQPGRPIGETAAEGSLISGRRNSGSRRVAGRGRCLWIGRIDLIQISDLLVAIWQRWLAGNARKQPWRPARRTHKLLAKSSAQLSIRKGGVKSSGPAAGLWVTVLNFVSNTLTIRIVVLSCERARYLDEGVIGITFKIKIGILRANLNSVLLGLPDADGSKK